MGLIPEIDFYAIRKTFRTPDTDLSVKYTFNLMFICKNLQKSLFVSPFSFKSSKPF